MRPTHIGAGYGLLTREQAFAVIRARAAASVQGVPKDEIIRALDWANDVMIDAAAMRLIEAGELIIDRRDDDWIWRKPSEERELVELLVEEFDAIELRYEDIVQETEK